MSLLLLLLLTHILSVFSLILPSIINPNVKNSSHEVYIITDGISRSDIIYCSLPNCVIQCTLEDSCKGIIINAIDIENVNIHCNSYDSCNKIQVNANNKTKVNMNCFYAHSCTKSNIFVINSYIQLLCNREDSCNDVNIFINKPLQNAINLSCNSDISCENLQIKVLNLLSNTNWLNITQFTNDFNIKLLCDDNNNITLHYSTELNEIQCNTNMICCPLNYFAYNSTDATYFYSTVTIPELSDLFLFQYFTTYIVPLLCISVIYTTLVFIWAMVYCCCNTLPTYIKLKCLKNKPSSSVAICASSSCWHKCGYGIDGINPITDIIIVLSIFTHSYLSNNTKAWFILGYISQGAMAFGIMFYILKLVLLYKFYPYILVWRIQRNKLSNSNEIRRRNNKISLLLKHLVLFDLFSASLSDGLMSFVILCICIDLNNADFTAVLLHNNWNKIGYFQWVLRIKLFICFMVMFYAIFNALSVECFCHTEKTKINNDQINNKSMHKRSKSDTDNLDVFDPSILNKDINYQSIKDVSDPDYDSDLNNKKLSHKNGKISKTKLEKDTNMKTHNTETEAFIEEKYDDVEMEILNDDNNVQNNIQYDTNNEEDDDLKLSELNVNISDNKCAEKFIKNVQNMSTFEVENGENNSNNNNVYVENDIKQEEEENVNEYIQQINDNNIAENNNESIEKKEKEIIKHNDIIKNILKGRPRRRSTGSKSQALLDSKQIRQSHIISKSDHFIQTKIKLEQLKDENSIENDNGNNDKIIEIGEQLKDENSSEKDNGNNIDDNDDEESVSQNTEIIYDSNNDTIKEYTPNSRTSATDSDDIDTMLEFNSND